MRSEPWEIGHYVLTMGGSFRAEGFRWTREPPTREGRFPVLLLDEASGELVFRVAQFTPGADESNPPRPLAWYHPDR